MKTMICKIIDFGDASFDMDAITEAVESFNERYSEDNGLMGELKPEVSDTPEGDSTVPRFSHTVSDLVIEDDGVYAKISLLENEYGAQARLFLESPKTTKSVSLSSGMVANVSDGEVYVDKIVASDFTLSPHDDLTSDSD